MATEFHGQAPSSSASSSATNPNTGTNINANPNPQLTRKRAVPSPRPGELLIYDCRPLSSSSPASATSSATHGSSPPTPTPGLKEATFPGRAAGGSAVSDGSSSMESSVSSSGRDLACKQITHSEQGAMGQSEFSVNLQGAAKAATSTERRPIRCLQWNIERNYKPAEILATLQELDADILCIQEIDIGCHRSGHERDHFLEICQSQGLYGGFVPEFWELEHPGRKNRDQGGGVHGNAILSKWPINGFRVLDHVHHAYEWERDGLQLNEPRLGRRFTIVADVQTPSGPLLCYCAHLEVFTGIVGRISALSDILADSELYSDRYPYQILFGDLNTISHSIARLAKTISTDQYRIASVGLQEAEWWDRNLWSWHVQDGEFNLALATGGWSWLRRLGFLGLGAGNHSKDGQETFWPADVRYTQWLTRLVGAGLDYIKQARQEQLLNDKFIALGQDRPSPIITGKESADAIHERASVESDRSFQDDGSIVLVGRARSPSIVTLESSLIDRTEYTSSSPTWSSSSAARYGDSENKGDHDGAPERGRSRGVKEPRSGKSSTPSTPSPTLRLIPPTPTQSRAKMLYGLTEEERGILLEYDDDDDEEDMEDEDENENEIEDLFLGNHGFGSQHFYSATTTFSSDNDTQHFNDQHSNDTLMNSSTTVTTSRQLQEQQQQQQQQPQQQQQQQQQSESSSTESDMFKDPQPPFHLSTLKVAHPFFSTQRLWSGFTPLVLHQARNPGFYDPWSARDDMTLHNPNFFGILKAKLDYTLLMNLKCVERKVGNHDYSASDHKWLLVEVEFEREFRTVAGSASAGEGSALEEKEKENQDGKLMDRGVASLNGLPSKTQRYLWWRERRLEWGQTVQPLAVSGLGLQQHAGPMKAQQRNRKSTSSSSGMYVIAATLTAAVAVGGAWLWARHHK
ncbi:hypothetical protein BGZ54_001555 [Gamsiella multidivaricata]|nr:hypothetical protein BGZ54_001555 [Gamsiella multidivaricata]